MFAAGQGEQAPRSSEGGGAAGEVGRGRKGGWVWRAPVERTGGRYSARGHCGTRALRVSTQPHTPRPHKMPNANQTDQQYAPLSARPHQALGIGNSLAAPAHPFEMPTAKHHVSTLTPQSVPKPSAPGKGCELTMVCSHASIVHARGHVSSLDPQPKSNATGRRVGSWLLVLMELAKANANSRRTPPYPLIGQAANRQDSIPALLSAPK